MFIQKMKRSKSFVEKGSIPDKTTENTHRVAVSYSTRIDLSYGYHQPVLKRR